MSYKTDKIVKLFPDVYAAKDTESLLYKLLDAIGAEHMAADEKINLLLKSHWVDYASDKALDGLGAIFGVTRRRLRNGELESDDAFRIRLKSVVLLFTGGGTVEAVLGAVRSALGLPFHLEQLNIPDHFEALRQDIEKLVTIREFSPEAQRLVDNTVNKVDDASELILEVDVPSVREDRPKILWTFTSGGGRRLSLECLRTEEGVKLKDDEKDGLVVLEGKTLVLSALSDGCLSAVIGFDDVSGYFSNLDDTTPAMMPQIPLHRSEWRFRAQSALLDISKFDDNETFDLPLFKVEMNWLRYQPLSFDVHVPYFLQEVVADLIELHKFPGKLSDLFVFEGLPLDHIQEVVNQTKVAGVRGNVYFSLNFLESHNHYEHKFQMPGIHKHSEDANAIDAFVIGSVDKERESHNVNERFIIGGIFDVSTFDGVHGFV